MIGEELHLKWTVTGNWRASTFSTGGGTGKRAAFPVKSSTRNVADIMTSFSGYSLSAQHGAITSDLPMEHRHQSRERLPVVIPATVFSGIFKPVSGR